MKKAADILKEMGFRPEASDGVKEAFVRHLIKAATGVDVAPGPHEHLEPTALRKPEQLSFDFGNQEATPQKTEKKIS